MVEVVLWCLEGECCIFKKIDGNSFKSTKTILWLLIIIHEKGVQIIITHINMYEVDAYMYLTQIHFKQPNKRQLLQEINQSF